MQTIRQLIFGEHLNSDYVQVYLHGKSGFESDAELFKYDDFPKLLREGELNMQHPFVVLHASQGSEWEIESVDLALKSVRKKYPEAFIHLIGYSRGGVGAFRYLACKNGAHLATVINSRITEFHTEVPVQIIHAKNDQVQPLGDVQAFIAKQKQHGLSIFLDAVDGDHFAIGSIAKGGLINKAIDHHRKLVTGE
jgi:predicted esterase